MPRAMWRGAISFGMVAIPVRLYLATESKSVSFRLLCPHCHTPIKNRRWCPTENREVGWNEVVRGFEVAKDEYIEITEEDLEGLPVPTQHEIQILEFVDDAEIDWGVYVDSAYYLEPETVGTKPYALLQQALRKTGKVAVAKIAFRDREHLCRVALHEGGLLLNTLHWPDEIRPMADLTLPGADAPVHEREVDMAVMLVENLSAPFDPGRYRDEYRDAVIAMAEAKADSAPLPKASPPAEPQVMDLMAALKASLEATRGATPPKRSATSSSREATAARTERPRRRKAS